MGHRIFSRLGLRGKTAIGLGALILAIIALVGVAGYWQARNFAEKSVFELEQSKFELMSQSIDAALSSDREDLLSMRGVNPVQEIARARDAGGIDPVSGEGLESLGRKLGTTFKAFMASHPQYLQMRYIDEQGDELVRVQRNDASFRDAPRNELHNEAYHPYVAETLKLPAGHVRTSDVHLQQYHGQIAVPHTPVLMLATPVHSEKNVVRGMIETTIGTDILFRAVVSEAGGAQRKISDEKGYFIKHPDPSKAFGFDLGFDYSLRDEEEPGFVELARKQDAFIRHHADHKEMDGFRKIYFDPENRSRYWLLTLNIPEELVFGEIDTTLNTMLAAGGIIGILAALIILWFVSRKIVSPIVRLADAASLMQGGNMAIRVDEASVKDEFRTLYATINAFADSQQHATERLEQEVSRATELLAESEVQNRLILDSAGNGIYGLDQDGNATFVNPVGCRMLGYEANELLGQTMHSLTHHSYPDGTPYHQDKCPLCATLIDGKTHKVIDAVLWRKDGTSFSVECTCTPMLRNGALVGAVVTFSDITERKKVEEELRLSSMVYQSSSEGMLVTDPENRIIAVNPAFTSITGFSFEEVKGKNPKMFSSGRHDQAFFKNMWHQINATGHWQGEVWDKRKSGEVHANWLTINTIRNAEGQVQRYVALFSDITEKKLSEELIWKQANFDALTELPNRRMFLDRLEHESKKSDRAGFQLALLLIDLDQFKEVNDTLGHDVGDTLLQEAARRICACVRESDTVARLGGDEFTVILPELSDKSHIEDIANKIIGKLAEPFHLGNEVAYVSASIGITLYPNDAADIDALMKNADQAMYVAKNRGRNRFSYFTPELQEAAQTRLRLSNDLRGALATNQFSVYFQPIVELSTGRIHKAEALLRWQHPAHGMISPLKFIPLAENMGLINEIGDWVFRESTSRAKRWSEQFAEDFKVSVNMSPVQFRAEGGVFAVEWLRHLQELGISGKNIVIEITEGLLLNAEPSVIKKLLVFRDAGIQVAIDDFGTGYSSLSYLKKFDIDYLKIDQSFVRNLETDPDDMALSEAIIVMAHKLGLKVIAEGVETEGQRRLLAAAGCDYAQGYLFSHPLPPEAFEALMKRGLSKS